MCCQGDDLSAPNDGPLRNDALHGLWLVPLAMVNISDSKTHIFFTLFVIFIISLVQFLSHFIIFIKKKRFLREETIFSLYQHSHHHHHQLQLQLQQQNNAAAAASATHHHSSSSSSSRSQHHFPSHHSGNTHDGKHHQQHRPFLVNITTSRQPITTTATATTGTVCSFRSFVRLLVRMTQYVMRRPTKTAASRKLHSRHSRSSAHIKSSRRISKSA